MSWRDHLDMNPEDEELGEEPVPVQNLEKPLKFDFYTDTVNGRYCVVDEDGEVIETLPSEDAAITRAAELRGETPEPIQEAVSSVREAMMLDITPMGLKTEEGRKREADARNEWDTATHALANALHEVLNSIERHTIHPEDLHQLKALDGARNRAAERWLYAVAGQRQETPQPPELQPTRCYERLDTAIGEAEDDEWIIFAESLALGCNMYFVLRNLEEFEGREYVVMQKPKTLKPGE